jgi:tight adherence protein F
LYRVTLCYETDNWAGELFETDFTTVQSSSVMMGR